MDIVRQSLAICFVFALLWAALWLLRKRGMLNLRTRRRTEDRSVLELRARLPLGAQHSLHLIRAGTREIVVATHPAGVTLLSELNISPSADDRGRS